VGQDRHLVDLRGVGRRFDRKLEQLTHLATPSRRTLLNSGRRRFKRPDPPSEIKKKCRKRDEHAGDEPEQHEDPHLRAFELQRIARAGTDRARNQCAHTRPALRAFCRK
jgi:hypothetical protein